MKCGPLRAGEMLWKLTCFVHLFLLDMVAVSYSQNLNKKLLCSYIFDRKIAGIAQLSLGLHIVDVWPSLGAGGYKQTNARQRRQLAVSYHLDTHAWAECCQQYKTSKPPQYNDFIRLRAQPRAFTSFLGHRKGVLTEAKVPGRAGRHGPGSVQLVDSRSCGERVSSLRASADYNPCKVTS